MRRITVFQRTFCRACTAVIVYDQRIFLFRVEMRGQVITSVDGIAGSSLEVPVVYLAQCDIFQYSFRQVFQADGRILFQIYRVEALRVGSAFAEINQFRSRLSQGEIRKDLFFQRNRIDLSI